MIGAVVGFLSSAVSLDGSIIYRRFDGGLREITSFRTLARLIENFIDAALFLDGQCLEDGSACLSFGRDLVGASAIEVNFGPFPIAQPIA